MTRSLLLLTTVAAFGLGGVAQAQGTAPDAAPDAPVTETPAPEAPSAAAPAAEAPATDAPAPDAAQADAAPADAPAAGATPPQLDTGQPEGAAAAPEDRTYIKTTEGAWDVQCLRVDEGTEPCQMYQLLSDGNGSSVAEVSMFQVEGGGQVVAGATFIVPLETLLTQKLNIQVDSGQAKRYDFSFCTQIGCYARVGFSAAEVAAFKAGQAAKVTIVPALAPDQRVTVNMSLSGFTAAYGQITALQQ